MTSSGEPWEKLSWDDWLDKWGGESVCNDCEIGSTLWKPPRKGHYLKHEGGKTSCRFPCERCRHLDCLEARANLGEKLAQKKLKAKKAESERLEQERIEDMAKAKTNKKTTPKTSGKKGDKPSGKKTAPKKDKPKKDKPKKTAPKDAPKTKVCSRCESRKSIDQFGTYSRSPDGYRIYCKACVSEMRAARRAASAKEEKAKEKAKAERAKAKAKKDKAAKKTSAKKGAK